MNEKFEYFLYINNVEIIPNWENWKWKLANWLTFAHFQSSFANFALKNDNFCDLSCFHNLDDYRIIYEA